MGLINGNIVRLGYEEGKKDIVLVLVEMFDGPKSDPKLLRVNLSTAKVELASGVLTGGQSLEDIGKFFPTK